MDLGQLTRILEAALLAADDPLSLNQLEALFPEDAQPGHALLREALAALGEELAGRSVELTEVASGFRLQVRRAYQPWIARLWQQRPPRYSRALLETLVLIAYRQPVTRGEIEEIRGVAVSKGTLDLLVELDWVRLGRRRMSPGRPATFVTTQGFLDHFGLESPGDLPGLRELRAAGLLAGRADAVDGAQSPEEPPRGRDMDELFD